MQRDTSSSHRVDQAVDYGLGLCITMLKHEMMAVV
jgi:hypothetical protein